MDISNQSGFTLYERQEQHFTFDKCVIYYLIYDNRNLWKLKKSLNYLNSRKQYSLVTVIINTKLYWYICKLLKE